MEDGEAQPFTSTNQATVAGLKLVTCPHAERSECACIVLPGGEILVTGGRSGLHVTKCVDIATIV